MTIDENRRLWAGIDWSQKGEEWSVWWGSSEAQWYWTILPRIHKHLPADVVLEIATGCGRWTQFLVRHAFQLVGVDLVESCIQACQIRFAKAERCSFFVNDGRSLDCVKNLSIDFCFSFDSLVHADEVGIEAYLEQLVLKLKPGGTAFIHHSNGGACKAPGGDRDPNMTAVRFSKFCLRFGMSCVSQELVNWDTEELSDCFSTVRNEPGRSSVTFVNPRFREEMNRARLLSGVL